MKKGITVILNGYERPHTIPEQLTAINNQTIKPEDVMLWYNQGDLQQYNTGIPKTAYCSHNFKFLGRFAYALLAKTEYIAIFDDDTIPGKKWFENCLNTMKTHRGILGGRGIKLTRPIYEHSVAFGWDNPRPEITEVDLVGHAWFFPREYLQYLWREYPISWDNGEDIQFSYLSQKYGEVKTYVPPHPHDDKDLWSSLKGVQHGQDKSAFSWKPSHMPERNNIVEEAIKFGWKPCFQRGV